MTTTTELTSSPAVPPRLGQVFAALEGVTHEQISRFEPPPSDARDAAVLVLLRETTAGIETLLVTRGRDLRAHAGQVAFPGGAIESGDDNAVAAAVRETTEETSLAASHLHPQIVWPRLWIPVSGFAVTPVFGWCSFDGEVVTGTADGEIVAVHTVNLERLVSPAHRVLVRYPNGFNGPGFTVDDVFVWGFTGLLLDRLLHFAGWEQPWDSAADWVLPPTVASPPDSLGPRTA